MDTRKKGFNTKLVHAGIREDAHGSVVTPIYQTSTFAFKNAQQGANRFAGTEDGYIYTRIGNPTVDVFEKRVAALEGGVAAVATASGQAAITLAIVTLAKAGDHIVAGTNLYGGTHTLFSQSFKRLGILASFVDSTDPAAFRTALRPETKAIYIEALGNPKLDVPQFEALAQVAREAGIPLIVDNTLASPWVCQPLKHGASLVVHSATKFLGGHGTSLGGVVVDGGTFDWAGGKFPEFTQPNPSYHGAVLTEVAGPAAFAAKARLEGLRDFGPALSPFNAFLLLLGIETLPIRMDRHGSNALAIAQWLERHPKVAWVNYPGLPSHPSHALARRYFREGAGFGGILTFGVKGGLESGRRVINAVTLFSRLANVGDAKSLIIHPATTTHQQLSPEDRAVNGVTDDLIRLSIGLENVEDLKEDLQRALAEVEA